MTHSIVQLLQLRVIVQKSCLISWGMAPSILKVIYRKLGTLYYGTDTQEL